MRPAIALMFMCIFGQPALAAPIESPGMWTGTWKLDRNRPEPDGAAAEYRFTVTGLRIVWEIPYLGEINDGTLNGTPFPILRRGKQTGEMLSVRQAGPRTLRYTVLVGGMPHGGGEMTLAADARSWTDVPLNGGMPVTRLTMVYIRQ